MSWGEAISRKLGKMSRRMHIDAFVVNCGLDGVGWNIFRRRTIREFERFFQDNKMRIKNVCSHLEDDLSKNVYLGMIKYRTYRKIKYRPYWSREDQYFVKDICLPDNNTIFADCGAFIGDTYAELRQYHIKQYIGFEPNRDNFGKLEKAAAVDKRVALIQKGVWNTNTELYITLGGGSSKCCTQNDGNSLKIDVVRLDDIKECDSVNWIKMDLEGSEMNALEGAVNLIKKNQPTLTICIYHSEAEMISIPEWIINLGLNYKYYVRHHSYRKEETVFYAIPR